jgi:hypothetical protein
MSSLLAKATIVWPIAATITPILLAIGLLWLRTKFAGVEALATAQAKIAALETEVALLKLKVAEIDGDIDSEPTRAQVIDKIGNAIERLSRLEGSIEGIERHMGSQSQWLQALALPASGGGR